MSRAAVLCGIGSALPPRLVTNDELAQRLDSSDEWIRTRTGIRQRYFATPGMTTSDLAVDAGEQALKSAGISTVDAVIVATTTPDRLCPATAPTVATRLGLGGTAAYDVSAVCTGFLYALAAAVGTIVAGIGERVLVIGAEVFSSILNPADRATSVIFGDGAGAVVLRAGDSEEPGAVGPFALGSDGDGRDLITVRAGGSAQRLSGQPPLPHEQYFEMAGKEVFWRAVQYMSESTRTVLTRTGWRVEDVDWLICHQANLRILHRLADQLGVPRERAIGNIAEVGNTSAASIPIAMDHALAQGTLRSGDRVVLTAFGGGLTWGATTLTWPEIDHSGNH